MQTQDAGTHQVLMLSLAGEVFAIDAQLVREILDPVPVTRVAGARRFVSSVLNVRGKVIPLADLRQRFGMPPAIDTADTRFVVIETAIADEPTTVGIIADKVYEVTELDHATLQPPPPVGMRWEPEFVKAIGTWNEDFIVIPNLARIFN